MTASTVSPTETVDGATGPIESFPPAMMPANLFGRSMDYDVFFVSRIHEEWQHSKTNSRAVRIGPAATGRVITAVAMIMICVFMAFVFGGRCTMPGVTAARS